MASRLKKRLSLAITKVALGLEDYSIRQISAHLSSFHDTSMSQPSQPAGRLAQPSNNSTFYSPQNKAPIGVFHPPSTEPNIVHFGHLDNSYFASNWDIENIPHHNVPSNISDEVIFQFIHDH